MFQNLLHNIETDARKLAEVKLRFKKRRGFDVPDIPTSQVKHRVLVVVIPENRVHIAVNPSFVRTVRQIQETQNVIIRVLPLRRWRR